MLISARDKVGPYKDVVICSIQGMVIEHVYACDTDARWLEAFVPTVTGKMAVVRTDKGYGLMTARMDNAQFDVVDRHSGEVLFEVR